VTALIRNLLRSKFIQDTLVLQAGKIGMVLLSLLSSVLVWRLMGPTHYGIFGWAQSMLVIWQSIDLTGVGTSTNTRLAIAIGAGDEGAILDLMAFYVKVNLAFNLGITILIAGVGAPVAGWLYNGNTEIGVLAAWLSVAALADGFYGLMMISLQSRRSMRALALMQYTNQFVLTASMIAAVVISPTPEALVAGRLFYSYSTLLLALVVYRRLRTQGQISYPPLRAIFVRAYKVSARPYWRFGVANAIDKNIASLFTQIPIQLVGILAGAHAVGYLNLALNGITQAGVFTSAVLDNMQAVVPQAVGRRDYAGLRRSFTRVLIVMALVGMVLFGALALVAPFVIPPILGARWIPAIPPLAALAIYGAITTVGGNFGPLYRAFNLMRRAIVVKLMTLAVVLPVGIVLLEQMVTAAPGIERFLGAGALHAYDLMGGGAGALGGALMIDLTYVVSVSLTAVVTLPELWKRAKAGATPSRLP